MNPRVHAVPAVLVSGLFLALAIAVLVVDGRCDRGRAGTPIFGTSESRIIGPDAVMSPPSNPKQDLRLSVAAAVSYDSTTKLYTYAYTVTNDRQSGTSLDVFGIVPLRKPYQLSAPQHWMGVYGWEDQKNAVVWSVVGDPNTQPDPDTLHTLEIPPSPYAPAPNTTTVGFVIVSLQPPATINFYAQGSDTLWDVAQDEGEELPNFNTLFSNGVTGSTLGPDINSVVGVPAGNPRGSEVEFRPPSPNPASQGVTITFYLPRPSQVELAVFDASGRRVRTLAAGSRPAGLHSVSWNGINDGGHLMRPAVYFTRLVVDGQRIGQRKITILR
jgi:hypothetical protein